MKNKKILSFIIVIIFLIPIGISSRITSMSSTTKTIDTPKAQTSGTTFTYGTGSGPLDIDPANAWDSASNDVILQICEQLYQYNMSDPNLPEIPWLASGMPTITNDGKTYTINLRQNITFSDGLPFNSTAVKDSFDRLQSIMAAGISQFSSLYFPFTPSATNATLNKSVICNVTTPSTYQVVFNLPYTYSPFFALLTFSGSSILSPAITTNTYYQTHLMEPGTWQIQAPIGTGPFTLESYTANDQVVFDANPTYWGGPDGCYVTHINTLIFQIIADTDTRNTALLSGSIQMTYPDPNYFAQFNSSSNINLVEGPLSTMIEYMGMNVENIPLEIREAASYAFNYSYALQNVYMNSMAPLTSIIPKGMEYYANNLTLATTNLVKAREILLNSSFLRLSTRSDYQWISDPSNNTAWDNIVYSVDGPIATYNYTCELDNQERMNLGTAFANDMSQIGIIITVDAMTWAQYGMIFSQTPPYTFKNLEFFALGWMADYNDPSDYINPLFLLNPGSSDCAMLNDTDINTWSMEALLTSNTAARANYYYQIQTRIVQQLFPWILIGQGLIYYASVKGVSGFQPNAMGYNYFAPINYTPVPILTAPQNFKAQIGNGSAFLTWSAPVNASQLNITGYRIYRGTSSGNEVALNDVGNIYEYSDTGLQNHQTYYYQISAILGDGTIGPKSEEISATPFVLPTAPQNFTVQNHNGYAYLSWDIPLSTNGLNIVGYNVYRGTSSGNEALIVTIDNALNYTDVNVECGQTYYYEISAMTDNGQGSLSAEQNVKVATTPSEPLNIQLIGGATEIRINWQAPQNDGGSSITGYKVYRGTSASNETMIAQLGNVLSFIDTSVTSGQTYYYQICAINANGDGSLSTSMSVLASNIPGSPINVQISGGNNQIEISWQAPQNSASVQITGYKIYRGTSVGSEILVATLGNVLSYKDTNVTNGKIYYYQICAFNSAGMSSNSTEIGFLQNNTISTTQKNIPGYNIGVVLVFMIASIGVLVAITKKKRI